jgi:hypothetical protein
LSKKVRIVFWGQGEFREDSENREISERIQRTESFQRVFRENRENSGREKKGSSLKLPETP